jgi:type II secretory ATPase GspE/PulE/Tfp pilus assembly ATPase PilB-like protein
MLELHIGPYNDLEAAERAAEALRLGYALSPQVMVQKHEAPRRDESRGAAPSGALSLGSLLPADHAPHARAARRGTRARRGPDKPLVEVLVESGALGEEEILRALGEALDLPVATTIAADRVDAELSTRFRSHSRSSTASSRWSAAPPASCTSRSPIPSRRTRSTTCACSSAAPSRARRSPAARDPRRDQPRLRPRPASAEALALDASEDLDALASEIGHAEPQDLLEAADDAPIIRLVNSLLQHAVKERASDIHLEPFEREVRVRFRSTTSSTSRCAPCPAR